MTQMTLIYTEYWYNLKKFSDNPRHLCHPRSISGYVELTLKKENPPQKGDGFSSTEMVSNRLLNDFSLLFDEVAIDVDQFNIANI